MSFLSSGQKSTGKKDPGLGKGKKEEKKERKKKI